MENVKSIVKDNWKHAMAMASYLFIVLLYGFVNKPNLGRVHSLVTPFDRNTPFIKYFIIPYNIWYPFIIFSIIYLILKNRDEYYRTLLGLDLGVLVCYAIYIVFQTTVSRPELMETDIFTKIVAMTYRADLPYNCFPSIHVFTTGLIVLAMLSSNNTNKYIKITWPIIGMAIIASTLYVKQHVVMDVFGGILLSLIMFYAFRKVEEEKLISWIKKLYSLLTMKKKLEI